MDVVNQHSWSLTPQEAVMVQKNLREQVCLEPYQRETKLISGADVSFNKYSPRIYAGIVVLDYHTQEVVAKSSAVVDVEFPYIPGLLSFREIPPLLEAWKRLQVEPDVMVFDGQGIAHPRRLGIASHMGLLLDKPTIGCGKSLLVGDFDELDSEAGASAPLMDKGEQVGVALRTKRRTNPVFISPGHHMDIESAKRLILGTVRGYRIPEPTRQAHLYVNELRRADLNS